MSVVSDASDASVASDAVDASDASHSARVFVVDLHQRWGVGVKLGFGTRIMKTLRLDECQTTMKTCYSLGNSHAFLPFFDN